MISIVMPNYNKGEYIGAAIESVISQTLSDWELIVVDDGSTDQSTDLVRKFTSEDSRVSLLPRFREPKGGSTCRNIGLEEARGDYVIFMDSDDLLETDNLETRLDAFQKNPHLDFMVFPMETFISHPGDCKTRWLPPRDNHLERFLSHDTPWHTMQPMWKKNFLLAFGGYNESFQRLQDIEFHSRVLFLDTRNYKISESANPDCYFRLDPERRHASNFDLLSNVVRSTRLYVDAMATLIEQSGQDVSRRQRAVAGTIFEVQKKILHYQRDGLVDETDAKRLQEQFVQYVVPESSIHRQICQIYARLYGAGFHRLTGFHFLFKKLYMSCRLSSRNGQSI